ncbi:unnamed protein product [Bursaphelenchus okinawaensis]|uniref:NR LBD domain-containing protein n=1 Tax=Bursaphelenchus okinawaensis TaxID=465554 RepID=A0A811KC60_9BILA|nr:unnamed protein product [Bursaphelenchus okinawaensis]CAG9098326.1 unnamed protein product [Bursaphelenchus okinawaensis]
MLVIILELRYKFNFKFVELAQHFRTAKPSLEEITIILLITFCYHYEDVIGICPELDKYKDRVLREWSEDLRARYKEDSYSKMIELTMLSKKCSDVNKFSTTFLVYIDTMAMTTDKLKFNDDTIQ